MPKLIILAIFVLSCGKDEQSSSFSRLFNYRYHELTQTVSVGDSHACAIIVGGKVLKCWGKNHYGQLGTGSDKPPQSAPVEILFESDKSVRSISAGTDHSCAILNDHSLQCWGNNQYGQVGDGSTQPRFSPTSVNLGENRTAKMVSTGNGHTCAILDDDSLKCWGDNQYGQIGIGNNKTPQLSPTAVLLGDDVNAKMISLGNYHTCAMLDNYSVKCWGDNSYGQLGDESTTKRNLPTPVNLGENRTALAIDTGGDHTCAHLDNHALLCWGLNDNGQLGDGTTTNRPSPTTVNLRSLYPPEALALGHRHSCILLGNGTPKCWGANDKKQLGDGDTVPKSIPVTPNLGSQTTARIIKSGSKHTCAIIEDDSLVCWGDNDSGQLGDGTTEPRSLPITVKL